MYKLLLRYRDNINSNNTPLYANESGVFLVASYGDQNTHHRIFRGDSESNMDSYSYPNTIDRTVVAVTDDGLFYIDNMNGSKYLKIKKDGVDRLIRSYGEEFSVLSVIYNLGRLFVLLRAGKDGTILDMINYTGSDFFLEETNYFDGRTFMQYKFDFQYTDAHVDNYNEVIYYRGSNEDGQFVMYTLDLINYSTKKVLMSNVTGNIDYPNYDYFNGPIFDENTMYFLIKHEDELQMVRLNTTSIRNSVLSEMDITETRRMINITEYHNTDLQLLSVCKEGLLVTYTTLDNQIIARVDPETFTFYQTNPIHEVLGETGGSDFKFMHVPITRVIEGITTEGHNQNRFTVTYIRSGISCVALMEWTAQVATQQLKNIKETSTSVLLSSDYITLINKLITTSMESFNGFNIATANRNSIAITQDSLFIAMNAASQNSMTVVKFAYNIDGGLSFNKSATYAIEGTIDNIQIVTDTIYLTSYSGDRNVGNLVCTLIDADSLEESLVERTYINLQIPLKIGDSYSHIFNGEIFTATYNNVMNIYNLQKNRIGIDIVHSVKIPMQFATTDDVIDKHRLLSVAVDHQFLFMSVCNDDLEMDGLYKYDVANLRAVTELKRSENGLLYLIGIKAGFNNTIMVLKDNSQIINVGKESLTIFNDGPFKEMNVQDLLYIDGSYVYILKGRRYLERIRMDDLHTDFITDLGKTTSVLKVSGSKLFYVDGLNLNNYRINPRFETEDVFNLRSTAPIKFPLLANDLAGIGRITQPPYKILYAGTESFNFNYLQNKYTPIDTDKVYAAKSFCDHITTSLTAENGIKVSSVSSNGKYQFIVNNLNVIKFYSHTVIGLDLSTNVRNIHPKLTQYAVNIKEIKFTPDSKRIIVTLDVAPWVLIFEISSLNMYADYDGFSTNAEVVELAINHDNTVVFALHQSPYLLSYKIDQVGLTPVKVQGAVELSTGDNIHLFFGKGVGKDDELVLEVVNEQDSTTHSFRVLDYLGSRYIVRRNPYPFSNLHGIREFNGNGDLMVTSDNRRIFTIGDIQNPYTVEPSWVTRVVDVDYADAEFFENVDYRLQSISITKETRNVDLSLYPILNYNPIVDSMFLYLNGIYASAGINYNLSGGNIVLLEDFMNIFEDGEPINLDVIVVDRQMAHQVVILEVLTSVVAVPFEGIDFNENTLRVYVGGIYQIADYDYIYDSITNTITTNSLNIRWEGSYVFDFVLVSKQDSFRQELSVDTSVITFPMTAYVNKDRLELFVGGIFYSKNNYNVTFTDDDIVITDKFDNFKAGYFAELIVNESAYRLVDPIDVAASLDQSRIATITSDPFGVYFLQYDTVLNSYVMVDSFEGEENGFPWNCSYSDDGTLFAMSYMYGDKPFRLYSQNEAGIVTEIPVPDALYTTGMRPKVKISGSGSHVVQISDDTEYLQVFKINLVNGVYSTSKITLPAINAAVLDFDISYDGGTIMTANNYDNFYFVGDGLFYETRPSFINPGDMTMKRIMMTRDKRFVFIGSDNVYPIHDGASSLYVYKLVDGAYNLSGVQLFTQTTIDKMSMSVNENIASILLNDESTIRRVNCEGDNIEIMDTVSITYTGNIRGFVAGYKNFILSSEPNRDFLRYVEMDTVFTIEDEYNYVDTTYISVNDIIHRSGITILRMHKDLLAIVEGEYITVDFPHDKFDTILDFEIAGDIMYILTNDVEEQLKLIKIGLILGKDKVRTFQMKTFGDTMVKSIVRDMDKQNVMVELYNYNGMYETGSIPRLMSPTYMIGREVISMASDYSTSDIYTSIITKNYKIIDGVESWDYTLHVIKSILRNGVWEKKDHVSTRIRSNSPMANKQLQVGLFSHTGNVFVIVYAKLPNNVKDFPTDGKVYPGETMLIKLTSSLTFDIVRRSDDGILFCGYLFANNSLMIEERNIWEVL
jgi:hypothetical protein